MPETATTCRMANSEGQVFDEIPYSIDDYSINKFEKSFRLSIFTPALFLVTRLSYQVFDDEIR